MKRPSWILLLLLAAGCAGLQSVPLRLPGQYSLVREQLRIYSDFPLASHHRLIEELCALRLDVQQRLALPVSDEPVYVYLFENADRFRAFMRLHHPAFPNRRAFFVETDTRLMVYAHWGDRVAEDLRHEVTHAYLHAVVPGVPLWLDEGLAEHFEVARGQQGVNRPHLHRLLVRLEKRTWEPDFVRMERLGGTPELTQDDYAEAWAWVHFLLHSRPENTALLHAYLAELRRDGTAPPISARFEELSLDPGQLLLRYLRELGQTPPGT